jgi:hypothetical protein
LPASEDNSPLLPLLSKLMLPQPRGVAVTATPVTAVHHTPHRAARTQRDRNDADIVLSKENPTMVIKRIALLQPRDFPLSWCSTTNPSNKAFKPTTQHNCRELRLWRSTRTRERATKL